MVNYILVLHIVTEENSDGVIKVKQRIAVRRFNNRCYLPSKDTIICLVKSDDVNHKFLFMVNRTMILFRSFKLPNLEFQTQPPIPQETHEEEWTYVITHPFKMTEEDYLDGLKHILFDLNWTVFPENNILFKIIIH